VARDEDLDMGVDAGLRWCLRTRDPRCAEGCRRPRARVPASSTRSVRRSCTTRPQRRALQTARSPSAATYILKLGATSSTTRSSFDGPYSIDHHQQPLGEKREMGADSAWVRWGSGASEACFLRRLLPAELLTIKSDDVLGRVKVYERPSLGMRTSPEPGIPELLIKEMQSLPPERRGPFRWKARRSR